MILGRIFLISTLYGIYIKYNQAILSPTNLQSKYLHKRSHGSDYNENFDFAKRMS